MEQKERIYFLDYLRVISCFLVLIVHSSETFYGYSGVPILSQTHRIWLCIWDGISRVSVPLFMMCSAYLLAPIHEDQDWGRFYRHRAARILLPMFIFLALYAVIPAFWGATTWSEAWHNLAMVPLNFPENAAHMWFMYPLLGLYLLIPFISPWLRTATAKQERLFLYLWAITTCLPYINRWIGLVFGQCWWNNYDMLFNFAGYPGYLVLAHYIKNHIHWDDAKRKLIGSAALAVGLFLTLFSFYVQADPGRVEEIIVLEIGWCFCTLNCVIYTFGAFLLFTTIHKPGKGYKLIADISRCSYGMYLMHMFWLWLWAPIFTRAMHMALAIPAIALATYICSYLTCHFLSKIPGSKWVIGC